MIGWKKTVLKTAVGLGMAMVLVGCEPAKSIYPFCEEKDKLFDAALIGSWATEKKGGFQMRLRLEQTSPKKNEYTIDLTFDTDKPDEGKPKRGTVTFVACLFQVGKSRFFDFYPASYSAEWDEHTEGFNATENLFQTSIHTVYRMNLEGDRLQLNFLDDDKVKKFARERDFKWWTEIDNHFLLLAPTQALQSQLLAQAEKEKLLDEDGVEFLRQK